MDHEVPSAAPAMDRGRDFELYHHVSPWPTRSTTRVGQLMKKAGERYGRDADLGPRLPPDHLRPSSIPDIPAGPAIEHRDYGVFAISGSGVKKDQVVYGPSVSM